MAKSKTPSQLKTDFARAATDPASRLELRRLEAERDKPPALKNELKPPSLGASDQDKRDEERRRREREARIKYLQERLARPRGKAMKAFDKVSSATREE